MKTIIAAASLFCVSVAQAAEQTVISESNRWGVVVLGALFVLAAGSAAIKLFLRPYRMKVFQNIRTKPVLQVVKKGSLIVCSRVPPSVMRLTILSCRGGQVGSVSSTMKRTPNNAP